MADFKGTILTQKGRNLLAKSQTGATLTFTKIKLGDGIWSSNTDPTQLNDLVSAKLNLSIQDIRVVDDGTVRLRFVLTNTGLSEGFFMREIGIYAQDPDIGEILYAVAYAGDRADFIPSDGVTKVENIVDIYTVIANSQNVTAVISDTVVLATKQDIDTIKPEASPTAPNIVYPGKLWVDSNRFLKYNDGSSWQDLKASFADTVDGFHASQTPAPNTILPLNANGRIYDYVASGRQAFDPPDFTMSNSTEYFIGSVSITTPSWSPSGAWKVIFIVRSYFYSNSSGFNNFVNRVKFGSAVVESGSWFWNATASGLGMGIDNVFLFSGLDSGVLNNFDFYVVQGRGNANAVFQSMIVDWYLIPA